MYDRKRGTFLSDQFTALWLSDLSSLRHGGEDAAHEEAEAEEGDVAKRHAIRHAAKALTHHLHHPSAYSFSDQYGMFRSHMSQSLPCEYGNISLAKTLPVVELLFGPDAALSAKHHDYHHRVKHKAAASAAAASAHAAILHKAQKGASHAKKPRVMVVGVDEADVLKWDNLEGPGFPVPAAGSKVLHSRSNTGEIVDRPPPPAMISLPPIQHGGGAAQGASIDDDA
jgi:hypothetical protein